ncbi:hypothetical protein Tco_1292187 [Tanacetum coccineum]
MRCWVRKPLCPHSLFEGVWFARIIDSFSLSQQSWYLDDDTIIGDTLVVGERKTHEGGLWVFSHIILPIYCMVLELLVGPTSVDFDFSIVLMKKRVAKKTDIMDAIIKVNDPQCELLLLYACAGIFIERIVIVSLKIPSQTNEVKVIMKYDESLRFRNFVEHVIG